MTADRLGTIDRHIRQLEGLRAACECDLLTREESEAITAAIDMMRAALTPAAGGAELEDWVIARFRAPLITFIRQHAEFTRYPGEDSRPAGYVDALMVRLERHLTGVEPLTTAAPAPPPAATGWIPGYRPSDVGLAKARAVRAAVEAALSAPPPADAVRALVDEAMLQRAWAAYFDSFTAPATEHNSRAAMRAALEAALQEPRNG